MISLFCCRYNIKAYGAIGDGLHNDTNAFLAALKAASEDDAHSTVVVPEGHFLVWPVELKDCKHTWIEIQVQCTM